MLEIFATWLFISWAIWFVTKPLRGHKFEYNSIEVLNDLKSVDISNEGKDLNVIVKDPYFDTSKIKEWTGETPKKFIFRPQTLNEYVGQDKAKTLVKLHLEQIEKLCSGHFMISGTKGCGKSTLAYIIKNELDAHMIELVAGQITEPDQLINMINEINESEQYTVLFIDEVHSLPPKIAEIMYPILEDFSISGKKIKPFTFIGATTEKNILVQKVAPLLDRISGQIELERYTEDDIVNILVQFKKQLYPDRYIKEENFRVIAKNCKFTPRIAIGLMKSNLIESDVAKVLHCNRIIKDGLTEKDIEILENLKEIGKPCGEAAISQMSSISKADYTTVYEPFLVESKFVIRTNRGRVIGKRGLELLEEIGVCNA